jgi:hypothetical protein
VRKNNEAGDKRVHAGAVDGRAQQSPGPRKTDRFAEQMAKDDGRGRAGQADDQEAQENLPDEFVEQSPDNAVADGPGRMGHMSSKRAQGIIGRISPRLPRLEKRQSQCHQRQQHRDKGDPLRAAGWKDGGRTFNHRRR